MKRELEALMADAKETEAVRPVVQRVVHDLNGMLSAVLMESFSIRHLAEGLPAGPTAEQLRDASGNLGQAAEELAAYVERLSRLAGR